MMHYAYRYWWCIAIGFAIGLWQNWGWIAQRIPGGTLPHVNIVDVALWLLVVLYGVAMVKVVFMAYWMMREDFGKRKW